MSWLTPADHTAILTARTIDSYTRRMAFANVPGWIETVRTYAPMVLSPYAPLRGAGNEWAAVPCKMCPDSKGH